MGHSAAAGRSQRFVPGIPLPGVPVPVCIPGSLAPIPSTHLALRTMFLLVDRVSQFLVLVCPLYDLNSHLCSRRHMLRGHGVKYSMF